MKKSKLVLMLVLSALFLINGFAQAGNLRDLVNARASSGESDLEKRGYVLTHTSKEGNSIYGYWWSPSAKKCVTVRTSEGRYASIADTLPVDCNQNVSNNNNGAKVAAGAITAGAIIGAIVLAHKAHHHDNDKHDDNAANEAEYERGFRDGLYNNAYHNYSNTDHYKKGYEAGVNQRREELSHSSGYGGYRAFARYNDLVGIKASSGESELQNRGFNNVDGFKSGSTSYTIWFNRNTRQCLQVATTDGRYDSITDIQTHPKCR